MPSVVMVDYKCEPNSAFPVQWKLLVSENRIAVQVQHGWVVALMEYMLQKCAMYWIQFNQACIQPAAPRMWVESTGVEFCEEIDAFKCHFIQGRY